MLSKFVQPLKHKLYNIYHTLNDIVDDESIWPSSNHITDMKLRMNTTIDIYSTLNNPLYIAGHTTNSIHQYNRSTQQLLNINSTHSLLCKLIFYDIRNRFIPLCRSMKQISSFIFVPNTLQQQHITLLLMYDNTVYTIYNEICIVKKSMNSNEFWRCYLVVLGNLLYQPELIELLIQQIYDEQLLSICAVPSLQWNDICDILYDIAITLGNNTMIVYDKCRHQSTQTHITTDADIINNTNIKLFNYTKHMISTTAGAVSHIVTTCSNTLSELLDVLVDQPVGIQTVHDRACILPPHNTTNDIAIQCNAHGGRTHHISIDDDIIIVPGNNMMESELITDYTMLKIDIPDTANDDGDINIIESDDSDNNIIDMSDIHIELIDHVNDQLVYDDQVSECGSDDSYELI